ncbi:uncharacterized protein F5891DRAFT_1172304 [Suillus fuscotomentosus]|uniref:Uncharacterized protein n=1 Tax=Suillus fuscotomentosus TaxID=1912939 RepID=A0AAD4E9K1_9AGAM|nr:uncharacterized protein F5891DRAFT_1172304 [Suillus fuscotomentosus]KAG1901861.1 hypothetical protein F5891DRAFT_1172304 [Suillus fuscotomentosus]
MLRELTLIGPPNKLEVDYLLAALRVTSFYLPVVTFQTDAMLSRVDANDIGSLLPVVEEVAVCRNSFQVNNSVTSEFVNLKLHTKYTLMSVCHVFHYWKLSHIEQSGLDPQKSIVVSCVFTIVVEAQCSH